MYYDAIHQQNLIFAKTTRNLGWGRELKNNTKMNEDDHQIVKLSLVDW